MENDVIKKALSEIKIEKIRCKIDKAFEDFLSGIKLENENVKKENERLKEENLKLKSILNFSNNYLNKDDKKLLS